MLYKGYYISFRYRLTYKLGLQNRKKYVTLHLLSAINNEIIDRDSIKEITII